ncbi:hypothetical protein QEN19_001380 [Hanseniaspora menglaensis]
MSSFSSNNTAALAVIAILAYMYFAKRQSSSQTSGSVFKTSLIKEEFLPFELIDIVNHTEDIATYRFKLESETHKLGLPIGQHITIQYTYKNPESGEESEIIRHYTPVSLDLETSGYFDLLIKKYPKGKMSQLFRDIKVGDHIKVRGPKGFYNYEKLLPKKKNLFMVCGGTGLTPMAQIIRGVYLNSKHNPLLDGISNFDETKITLIYGNQKEEDILLKKELDELVAKMDGQLSVYYILDQAPKDVSWVSKVGYADKELLETAGLKATSEDDNETQVLLCGPQGLVSGMKRMLTSDFNFPRVKPITKMEDKVFVF